MDGKFCKITLTLIGIMYLSIFTYRKRNIVRSIHDVFFEKKSYNENILN